MLSSSSNELATSTPPLGGRLAHCGTKTARALADEHAAQVLGYLKSARLEHSLLINFGSYKFEVRKFVWSQDAARRKSKPTFLLFTVSAFFEFFAV